MRTPPQFFGAFAIALGVSALASPASANTSLNLDTDCTSWSIANKVFTCSTTPVTPGAPSCTGLSSNAGTSLASNAPFVLTPVCTGTNDQTQWVWKANSQQVAAGTGPSASTYAGNLAASATYTVTATNPGVSQSGTASINMTVASANPPPTDSGTIGAGVACSKYAHTITMPLTWPTVGNVQGFSSNLGSFGSNDVLVIKIHTPPQQSNGAIGTITVGEYVDNAASRMMALSTSACEFTGALALTGGVGPSVNFSVGPNARGLPALDPDRDYFVNVKNVMRDGVTSSCVGRTCNVLVEFAKP